jgi:hypothetical protein
MPAAEPGTFPGAGVRSNLHARSRGALPGPSIISDANEILGAKLGANTHRHQATPGHVQPQSWLVNCPSGDAQPRPATEITRLTSEGPVVRTHLRPLF